MIEKKKSSPFKDLFSGHAPDYAKFRPHYPDSLFQFLAELAPSRDLAWDCATGNGQAAVRLAEMFKHVIATDPSEPQLANAVLHSKVEYKKSIAEASGLSTQSLDLITVAQAFHWFKVGEFFQEAHRVLRPSGILAVWCYGMARISPEIEKAVWVLYRDTLGPYWEKERTLVDQGYSEVRAPSYFEELRIPKFSMTVHWSWEQWVGYLGTWSALRSFVKKNGEGSLKEVMDMMKNAWGSEAIREIRWPLAIRVWRKNASVA